jgi:hypothetical protein
MAEPSLSSNWLDLTLHIKATRKNAATIKLAKTRIKSTLIEKPDYTSKLPLRSLRHYDDSQGKT